ncbi:hypothetical protein PF005_g23720 [Phytophthora fragariae]|uniref:U2A'/phosphoprotein 32 family A C-terminal domain-containing protein n=1 Tax=Phytophthora fragariae TaxID=53985 RepID=A0A6A3S6A8_9STRA|nr:hypothetical protein PF003_g38600 [Phytophthora fragariae]KAE8925089.1 hypothetical protein PF009_g24693 [Phytophthora fragariae]KAE9084256.1 hypothetical protein PF007_g21583 [Phytophthora fragariae]KAE9109884.1 hypothetical protein PF006_g20570 [Phytophthora fragariae]KAE9179357.1 hypothetical protein PF005_g23720 [Phytophthora fragariae]
MGILSLEEISLHQEKLEKIEVIGTLCRKLRILYLHNNIINKMEDLTHMKKLRSLNEDRGPAELRVPQQTGPDRQLRGL